MDLRQSNLKAWSSNSAEAPGGDRTTSVAASRRAARNIDLQGDGVMVTDRGGIGVEPRSRSKVKSKPKKPRNRCRFFLFV